MARQGEHSHARHANDPRLMKAWPAKPQAAIAALICIISIAAANIGAMLLSWHNLAFYQELMAAIRAAIEAGKFEDFRAEFYEKQKAGDLEPLAAHCDFLQNGVKRRQHVVADKNLTPNENQRTRIARDFAAA